MSVGLRDGLCDGVNFSGIKIIYDFLIKNKNLVFTSFGDPYKLMELPFLKTYINAYIASDAAATAVVQACLGFASLEGKNPVIIPSVCNTNESSF